MPKITSIAVVHEHEQFAHNAGQPRRHANGTQERRTVTARWILGVFVALAIASAGPVTAQVPQVPAGSPDHVKQSSLQLNRIMRQAWHIAAWGAHYAAQGNWPEACRFYALAAALGGGMASKLQRLHGSAATMLPAKEQEQCIERARETHPYDGLPKPQ